VHATNTTFHDDTEWFAVYTRHQHEKVIADLLSMKGFEIFLPLYRVVHLWKDRKKQLNLPLFPCYLFVKADLKRRLEIVTTPGVCCLVGASGQPSAIPASEIDPLQKAISGRLPIEPYPHLRTGDRVRIRSGPLEGIEGSLVRKKGTYCLVLSVEVLGRAVAVEVDTSMIDQVRTKEWHHLYSPFTPGFSSERSRN
jgi:transcription antitermination factor NusG